MNLIIRFKIDRDARCHVRTAARISVAGDALTLVDLHTGAAETLPLARIEVLSIQSLPGARPSVPPPCLAG